MCIVVSLSFCMQMPYHQSGLSLARKGVKSMQRGVSVGFGDSRWLLFSRAHTILG